MHASIVDMTLRLPIDEALFEELRADFVPMAFRQLGTNLVVECGHSAYRDCTSATSSAR